MIIILLQGNSCPGRAFSGLGNIRYFKVLVSDADAGDTIGDDTLVSAGLLCWDSTDDRDVLFAAFFFFPWEDDILLSKLFFFHRGVQVNLALDAEDGLGVVGELGGDVLVLVGDVEDGDVLLTSLLASPCWAAPCAPTAPWSRTWW